MRLSSGSIADEYKIRITYSSATLSITSFMVKQMIPMMSLEQNTNKTETQTKQSKQ